MTRFLTKLITDETPILKLNSCEDISKEEKIKVLGINGTLSDKYSTYMYKKDNKWYYFKQEKSNGLFPFYIFEELMGSYLAKIRNLPTVIYQIAEVDKNLGIASVNFKKEGSSYYRLEELLEYIPFSKKHLRNIEGLKSYTIDELNEKEFMTHLFNFFALDIHMLQCDRGDYNLQFQINDKTKHFDIAPLYDYSNCFSQVGVAGLNVMNKIVALDYINIPSLCEIFPEFKTCLELCLEQNMSEIWEQICIDYHFNQDCSEYERIKEHYEIKDESQKRYIKSMLNK